MRLNNTTRRDFMTHSIAGLSALSLLPTGQAQAAPTIPTRPLGKTGEEVSMLGLGGYHIGTIKDDAESIAFIRQAIDLGVTFLDNAWEYHDGRSEELMGRALRDGYREKAFLMTKHHGRDKTKAMTHLDDSLRRLQTDVIDLWQFHEVVYPADPGMIFASGGGIEAAIAAKESGKVKYIGFTGHKDPAIFLDMLRHEYPWDAVQMPINVFDPHYKSFLKQIVPLLVERKIGVIAMKTLGSGHILRTETASPEECLRYAWSQPVSTIVSGMENLDLLRQNVAHATNFSPMPREEQTALLARTKEKASAGEFEPFKSSNAYDGPVGRTLHGVA